MLARSDHVVVPSVGGRKCVHEAISTLAPHARLAPAGDGFRVLSTALAVQEARRSLALILDDLVRTERVVPSDLEQA